MKEQKLIRNTFLLKIALIAFLTTLSAVFVANIIDKNNYEKINQGLERKYIDIVIQNNEILVVKNLYNDLVHEIWSKTGFQAVFILNKNCKVVAFSHINYKRDIDCNSNNTFLYSSGVKDSFYVHWVSVNNFSFNYTSFLKMTLFTLLFVLIGYLFIFKIFNKEVENFEQIVFLAINDKIDSKLLNYREYSDIFIRIKEIVKEKLVLEDQKWKFEAYRQVAHDIRSPLEALKFIVKNLGGLDYNSKKIVVNSTKRISEIANGLLKAGQGDTERYEVVNLAILLEDIVLNKNFTLKKMIHLEALTSYKNANINADENQIYRAISNIVNNGVEAQKDTEELRISLSEEFGRLIVTVKDFGEGMSESTLQKVLQGGVTTKKSGNGLGLSYSKRVIERYNGEFLINSEVGKGTIVKISFLKLESPSWLEDQLIISSNIKEVICVDDDLSFLYLYEEKFKNLELEKKFINPEILTSDLIKNDVQFFIDYDFSKEYTGLDFIIKNGLESNATLVTSMYKDQLLQNECIERGIRIIPKEIFNNTLVVIEPDICINKEKRAHILIDDDDLIHALWDRAAKKENLFFTAFKSVDDFLRKHQMFNKQNAVIYIDSNLSNGLKGEVESEKIADLGFCEIYLTTGYSENDIEKPSWIKKVIGKRPDFIS